MTTPEQDFAKMMKDNPIFRELKEVVSAHMNKAHAAGENMNAAYNIALIALGGATVDFIMALHGDCGNGCVGNILVCVPTTNSYDGDSR